MYNIAVDVLSVPATPALVEWVFSRASYILSKKDYDWYAYTYAKITYLQSFWHAYMPMQCNMHSFLNMQYDMHIWV